MFVDIVGFAKVAETHNAEECFLHLKSILSRIADYVKKYGGKVDKTMGDGVLCVFGHDGLADHAARALRCAVALQRESLDIDIQSHLKSRPVYPLRIGINTGEVFMGDLGDSLHPDVTVIGHGVNIANRLEAACDGYSIMLGATSYSTIREYDELNLSPRKRLVQIKHHDELLVAYECNPFEDRPELLNQAIDAYRNFAGISRKETRWPVPSAAGAVVACDAGEGPLVDFSDNGFSVRLPTYLARGIQLHLEIKLPNPALVAKLRDSGIDRMVGEVRWGRPAGDAYLHGFQLKFRHRDQSDKFVNTLKDVLV